MKFAPRCCGRRMQEFGADHSPLPATTFAYSDAMHLIRADNVTAVRSIGC